MRERASEREKLYIQAHYYDEVVLDFDKTLAAYAEWRQTYPRDAVPYDNAALAYTSMGQHEKALDLASQAMRVDSKDAFAYQNLASAYLGLNRLDEAKSVCDQALTQKIDGIGVRIVLADVAYIRGDWTAYDHQIESGRGTPDEAFLLFWKAAGQAGLGKLKASHQTWQQARSELLNAGIKDFAGGLLTIEALNDASFGYPAEARQKASQALEISTDRDIRAYSAQAFASAGDVTKSSALLAGLNREFPENQFLHLVEVPMVQAQQFLQKNQPAEAIAQLETVRPYELGVGPHGSGFMPNHLRGLAYLKLRDGTKAAAEFQRILDHRGVSASDPLYALAHLNLGRAYVLEGDKGRARTAYQDFFAIWKGADPDAPILVTAKSEYEKLN